MKAKIQQINTKDETVIPFTPQWASRKAEANLYIASAVQHMRTTENIDGRTYSITAHTDVRQRGAKDYLSNKYICISLYKAISSFIASTYQGEKAERGCPC
ncbi:hypothetical protein [Phaeobacter sp. SYSU ZJ3003]|uniref:hypothetical protein n=1 Tax=Phaeobacter sp. SYSU ZJ3003 TaxID=2109330 RepID=UPI00351C49DA